MKKIFGEFSLPAFCCGYAIGFAGKLRCVIDNASIHKNRKSRGNIMKAFAKLGVLVAAAGFATAASAALVNAPVPVNAYITYGGLNWAWAAPVDESFIDLSYQTQFGWRLPTDVELANAPSAMLFIFQGANVPFGGTDPVSGAFWSFTDVTLNGDAALASPYFTNAYYHGDWCNGIGSNCSYGQTPAWNRPQQFFNDSLVVRNAVPEPASWAMMITGFGLVGTSLRRRQKALTA